MAVNTQQKVWFFYGLMISAILLYVLVGFLSRSSVVAASELSLRFMARAFMVVAGIETIIVLVLLPRFAGKMPYLTYGIVRWAMAESVAVEGLVLFYVGAGQGLFLVFLGWSLALMLLCAPTEADREKHELLQRS